MCYDAVCDKAVEAPLGQVESVGKHEGTGYVLIACSEEAFGLGTVRTS